MKTIEEQVNHLVGDTASCDHYGCRCWQAVVNSVILCGGNQKISDRLELALKQYREAGE